MAWKFLLAAAIAYLLGSVPWGLVVTQVARGIDVRKYGSGNIGMANVLRTAGGRLAAVVVVLDMAKGVAAVLLARWLTGSVWGEVAAGLLSLAGHNWSVFLGFKGGRGVNTGAGGLAAAVPWAFPVAVGVFVIAVLKSKYISLASILAVSAAALAYFALALAGVYSWAYAAYVFPGSAVIIWRHRENVARLLTGKERKVGAPATPVSTPSGGGAR